MKYKKSILFGLTLSLSLVLSACDAAPREPEVLHQSTAPLEQFHEEPTEQTPSTIETSKFWEDVVELVNGAGETTTVYKLEDGRYLDRMDRFFTYDGSESWICDDGSSWSKKPDAAPATTKVSAEFAIERLLSQRPDAIVFSEEQDSAYASKIVLTFDTPITNFHVLRLEGSFDQSGAFLCTDMQPIYSRDELTENDLMVVQTVLGGLVPNRGISFVDAGGNTRYYYLALSGEDNVPLVIPFQ